MRPITFRYLRYKGVPAPIIPVALRGPHGWQRVLAYVDSGASYSILSTRVAEEMGLRAERGHAIYVLVGDGSAIPVYLHRLPLRIGPIELTAPIGFSPRLGVGFNLLGRQDIFTHFDITFSDATRRVIFRPRSR